MKKRIAINGFGRIGRLFYRALLKRDFLNNTVEVVAVNDLVDAYNLAYLLKYDTANGVLEYNVKALSNELIQISNSKGEILSEFKTLALKEVPSRLPWADYNVDTVIESTGLFTSEENAKGHLEAHADNVIISAPAKGDNITTYLIGINADNYQGERIISNASCTTNAIAPIIKVLLANNIGIQEGILTTIHAYTADQNLQDAPHKDYRRGRNASMNIVPTSSGSAQSMGDVFPELEGKLTGMAFRVPVHASSCIDFTVHTKNKTSLDEISQLIKESSSSYLKDVIGYTDEPVVSSDFIGNPLSSIYDHKASIELNSNFFKLVAWYDNEWGYANRLVDLLQIVSKK